MQSTSALPPTERADDWDLLSGFALEKGLMQIHYLLSAGASWLPSPDMMGRCQACVVAPAQSLPLITRNKGYIL